MKNIKAIHGLMFCLMSASCSAAAPAADQSATPQIASIPDGVRSLLEPGDALLAYKTFESSSDKYGNAVIIVRHQTKSAQDQNPCELIVLQNKSGSYTPVSKSANIVDCKYNNFAKNIAKNPDDLNDYLELKPFQIIYSNLKSSGHNDYEFRFSEEKKDWYASRIDIAYSQSNEKTNSVEVVKEQALYPKDFDWMPMSAFDVDKLQNTLNRNKTIVK